MSKRLFFSFILSVASLGGLSAANVLPFQPNPSDIRIVPVERTPESNTVQLEILFPERSEIKRNDPVRLQFKILGFPLWTNSEFPRMQEVWNDPAGQNVHVVIDNKDFFSLNRSHIKNIEVKENYRTQIVEVDIPFNLEPGEHVVRAFLVRSFTESLKNRGTFAVDTFYYRSQNDAIKQNLKAPFLTYNEPIGSFDYGEDQPILLDFLLSNSELSGDGYKVELSIDEKIQRYLVNWVPYYIYGLPRGSHTIRLRLLDPQNKPVPGEFNDLQEKIVVN